MNTNVRATREADALLDELRGEEVELWVQGRELRYRAPAGVLTESRKAAVRGLKSELIALLTEEARAPGLSPVVEGAEAVWMPTDCQFGLAADPQPHHFHRIVRMCQPIDLACMEATVNYLVRRHDILRTRYVKDAQGRLWAATASRCVIPLGFTDLAGLSEERRESAAKDLAVAATRQPFDLSAGPLLRLEVMRLRPEEFVLVFVVHHSIFDGWSATIWASELATAYAALAAGREPALPALPLEFREFAARQRASVAGPAMRGHLAYWREKLRGASTACWLPRDRQTPVDACLDLPPTRHRLGAEAVGILRQVSRNGETTMLVTMLTLFAAVLRRWSTFDDIFVWMSHAGRPRAELQGLIGCFFDVCPLRLDLSGNPRFPEALERVKRAYVEALPHICVTPMNLAPDLHRERGGRHFPGIIFNYLPDATPLEPSGSAAKPVRHAMSLLDWVPPSGRFAPGSPHALSISPFERAQSAGWSMQHSSELFEDATIERASLALAGAVEILGADPGARLDDLVAHDIAGPGAMSFEAEAQQRTAKTLWWRTAAPYPEP